MVVMLEFIIYNINSRLCMEPDRQLMIDERTQFLEKWVTSGSCHQSRDHPLFLSSLLHIVEHDHMARSIFSKNLVTLLQSHQSNLQEILEYCISEKNRHLFHTQICQFVSLCFRDKHQVDLSAAVESYLLHNIWTSKMQAYTSECRITAFQILEYISLRMRSLDLFIRSEAVSALFDIIESLQMSKTGPLYEAVTHTLPEMIEKENYGKEVCFSRGVLLQILEDEFCCIKKKGIELLGKAQCYLEPVMIRPLLLYMLNDQHQAVREMCLVVLSQIPSLDIEKEDLSALLICLKENNSVMRSYTYQNLPHINITSAKDFNLIVQRLYSILPIRSEDKKKIYMVCSKLGSKYPNYVLENLDNIYKYQDKQEPNWKSLVYRARFITVAAIGLQKWPRSLPKYFNNHYLYIRDVLLYVFEQKGDGKMNEDINEEITQEENIRNEISINLQTDWQLYHYIAASEAIAQGFLKSAFGLILDWVRVTGMGRFCSPEAQANIIAQVQKMEVIYNIMEIPLATQFLSGFVECVLQTGTKSLRDLLQSTRDSNGWACLEKVERIIFKVSNADKSKIVISNVPQILKRSFIEFGNLSSSHHSIQANSFLKMSQVDFQQINNKICYYRIGLKCRQIRCFILYGQPPQQHITQTATYSSSDSSWVPDVQ